MKADEQPSREDHRSSAPGLLDLRTWRMVYLVVLAFFVLWVILLTVLPKLFP